MCLLTAIVAHTRLLPSQQLVTAGFVTMIFFGRWQSRKRSRFIPKATRRAVIRRDLKGEAFDPEKHHIDHVWPFSRGGSHTTDNLRVIEKKRNLQKGAKRPRMREMCGNGLHFHREVAGRCECHQPRYGSFVRQGYDAHQ